MSSIKMILGPPGTGKTSTLLKILEEELTKVQSTEIAYVSYTRKGAYEGRDRARNLLGLSVKQLPYFRTLHSIAFKALELTVDDMLSSGNNEQLKQFGKKMGLKLSGIYTEEFYSSDDTYLFFDNLHRNNPKTAESYLFKLNTDVLKWVRANYRKFKKAVGLLDFTDVIERFVEQRVITPVKVAIIDEAQDLTTLQWTMVWQAFQDCERIYIAGDDDQAIYEWSGADVDYFLSIKAEQQILDHSYRLPRKILEYSKEITSLITRRIPKKYEDNGEEGELLYIRDFKDVDIDNGEEWLFLSRNNCFLKEIELWLKDIGKVYYKKEESSVSTAITKAISAHAKISKGATHTPQDVQMVKFFCQEEPSYKRPWYEELSKLKPDTINYYRRLIGSGSLLQPTNIRISTVHGIKGGEADNVVLLTDITKSVAKNYNLHPDSELRCYYVGVTRARKKLYIVEPQTKFSFPILGELIDE